MDDAVADRSVVVNPARGVKLPRRKRGEQTYLTMAQLQALAEQAGSVEGSCCSLASADCGSVKRQG
ncbi:hypothetical protein ACETU7_05690 [Rhodococcus sp. 3Y1]